MKQAVIQSKKIIEKREICGGAPVLKGTRIRVSDIVIEYEHKSLSPEEISREFPSLTIADVFSALTYYYEHPAKIREEIGKREKVFLKHKAG